MNHAALLGLAASLLTATAHAEPPALRPEITVSGEIVRYGDLVSDAGDHAATPLFRAPALGGVGSIRADRIAAAARELGLAEPDLRGLQAIVIRRPARNLDQDELVRAIGASLSLNDRDLAGARITLDPFPAPLRVATSQPVPRAEITAYDNKTGRFSARLQGFDLSLTGTAEIAITIPVLNRPVGKGDVLHAHDFSPHKVLRRDLALATVQEAHILTGSIARRALQPGQPLRESDVMRPELVEKNQPVTVTYDMPGMVLTLRGRALSGGAAGATVSILNPASKRTIEAVVTGPGQVTARTDAKPADIKSAAAKP